MAIRFRRVSRLCDPTNKELGKKVYPVISYQYDTSATLKEIAKEISSNSGVSEGETISVLKDFRTLLRKTLLAGRSVNIEGLGYFFLSAQSKGTEKAEDFTSADIQGLRICFRANSDIRLSTGTSTRSDGLKFKDLDHINKSDVIGGNPDDREAENYVRIAPTPSATQSDGNLVVWLAAGVFGILFMFCGYLLIYNVFDMGVTNDVRQYGLLRTIGMTPKQVKGLVRKQAMYLFLIGTPIGVLLGILLGKGMLPAVLQMFVAELGEKNVVVVKENRYACKRSFKKQYGSKQTHQGTECDLSGLESYGDGNR